MIKNLNVASQKDSASMWFYVECNVVHGLGTKMRMIIETSLAFLGNKSCVPIQAYFNEPPEGDRGKINSVRSSDSRRNPGNVDG